ncbi:hypothetical protein COY95_02905, partial [Candidatus Woesearchaeota archaeon CG_4_10_14_0_8_um_filter_47_5]
IKLDELNITYLLNERSSFTITPWWVNDTGFNVDTLASKRTYYQKTATPSVYLKLKGFIVDRNTTQCSINGTASQVLSYQYWTYCRLNPTETINLLGSGTWKNHYLSSDYNNRSLPVRRIVEINTTFNVVLEPNGSVSAFSSEQWFANNVIDGLTGNEPDKAWKANDTDAKPWVRISLNSPYYVTYIRIANGNPGLRDVTLVFSDGTSVGLTLPNETSFHRYNLS